jgi:hypothetical protein
MSDNRSFMSGICVALQHVTASDNGVLWREIVESVGVDEMLDYAARVEPDEWHLSGFDRYAFTELRRQKPRTRKTQTIQSR